MPGHLDPAVVKSRAAALRRAGEEKKREYAARFVGRELPLLLQSGGRSGITGNYLTVRFAAEDMVHDAEVMVRITGINRDGSCRGEIVR